MGRPNKRMKADAARCGTRNPNARAAAWPRRRRSRGHRLAFSAAFDAHHEDDEVNMKDIALVAYRLLALWLALSGLQALAETLLTWKSIWIQMQPQFAGVSNSPTQTGFFVMTTSALAVRALFGLLLWWLAPALARCTPVGQMGLEGRLASRADLFSAAAFLVGVWLLAGALPGLAYSAYVATRPGTPAYDDGLGGARIAQLVAQVLIGVAFVKGRWLVELAISEGGGSRPTEDEEPGVEQDGADERRPG